MGNDLRNIVVDTSSLMENDGILDELINVYNVIINIVVVEELDNLKTNKDFDRAFKAKRAIRSLEKYKDSVQFDLVRKADEAFTQNQYNLNDDVIVTCAKLNNAYLMTEDLNLRIKANVIGVTCSTKIETSNTYKGFKRVKLSDVETAYFYEHMNENQFDSLINEYIVITNNVEAFEDTYRWDGNKYIPIKTKNLTTVAFGSEIKPKDVYQRMVIDSILNNTMTVIAGEAGSGKSLLALVTAMYLVENRSSKYERIVVLANPTKTRGATDMGFYTGSAMEKLMQCSIGNVLNTKFGERNGIDQLIAGDKLRLVSMADCRGMEVRDDEILYITEAQNTTVDLMKLCLSRASSDCKIIIEGDYNSQVDSNMYENKNNGMKRAIEVLKGEDIFGYVELQNVWRSKIANLVYKF